MASMGSSHSLKHSGENLTQLENVMKYIDSSGMMRSMRYAITVALWLLTDCLFFVTTYIAAYFLRVGLILSTDFPFDHFLTITVIVSPLFLLVLLTTRTFALMRNQATARNAAYIAYSCLVGTALFTLAYYFTFTAFFSRLLLLYAFTGSTVAIFLWHVLYQRIQRSILHWDPPVFPTLIVGLTRESQQLIDLLKLKKNPLVPVAILDGHGIPEKSVSSVPVLGKLNILEETLLQKRITHLIQCADLEQSLNLLSACRKQKVTYMLLPSVLGMVEGDERIESLKGHPITMVPPKFSWWNWFFR